MGQKKFEILCVTMHQNDFSKLKEMNVHSDIVYANQCNHTSYEELCFDGEHTAKMISTQTRGVGINRNTALMYAEGEICLFADDDVVYCDDMEEKVVREFDNHPDADIFIFNLTTDDEKRKQKQYKKTRRCTPWEKMPWAGFRIAIRLNSVRKANIWFTTLFGGGCVFPSGEDSMWLLDAKRKGLRLCVSEEVIGQVSFAASTWFTGHDESFFFGKGAFYAAVHPRTFYLWAIYFVLRTSFDRSLTDREKMKWLRFGREGYRKCLPFSGFLG